VFERRLCASLLLGIVGGFSAWGQSADTSQTRALPHFDAREPAAFEALAGEASAVLERRRASLESFAAERERATPGIRIVPNRYGLPKLLLRDGKPLTAPSTLEPEEIAKSFLRDHAAIFPLAASEVDGLRLTVKDVTSAATFLAFNQTLDGIDVFDGQIRFTLSKSGEVVQAGAVDIVPELSLSTVPGLGAEAAVRAAFDSIGGKAPAALSRVDGQKGGAAFHNPRGDLYSPITAELSIFPMTASSARLAYRVFLEADSQSWYEILIDAQDGSLLLRHNLYVSAAQARVWTESPTGGARQLVPLAGTVGDPWLPANGTVTTGNNVDAYIRTTDDNTTDPVHAVNPPDGRAYSSTRLFDFPFGDGALGLNPRSYAPAAVTNLFYFVNVAHDYFYGLGFNERAGNFQTDNFGRGGSSDDAVLAEAQYRGFTGDSRFAPTPDGTAPRMRMGLYTSHTSATSGNLDADYDGQTVIHEYGHGVGNRLVGAGTGTSCLAGIQSGALGEGWSDYFAISFFQNPVYGAYPSGNVTRGLRRQSYDGYTLTYADLGKGDSGYEVHDDGEIWAATLWDLRKSLGQAATDQLVIDGLKSTPCSPSMTDARDAILSADLATNGAANRAGIWQVFARHGLGYSAIGADGGAPAGTRSIAAFDLPADLQAAKSPAIAGNQLSIGTGIGDADTYRATASNPVGGAPDSAQAERPAATTGSLVRIGTLSHIAAGGSWDTAITLFNTSSTPISTELVFHAEDGSALSLPLSVTQSGATQSVTAATLNSVINPQSTLVVDAGSAAAALVVGWADVLSTGPVNGFAIFRTHCPTCTSSEGTVALQSQFQSALIVPYDNTSNYVTGVALANLSTAQASLTATIWDTNGALLGAPTITLAGSGHTSFVMPTGLPLTTGKSGTVLFQNPSGGALDGIGLRFSPDGTFTSVPTILQTPPQITSLSPTSGSAGTSVSLTISGSNLSGVTAVQFSPSTGITVSNVNATATQVTATVTIAASTPGGQVNVAVSSSAVVSNTLTFTIFSASTLPQITLATPKSLPAGNTVSLSITGTNLSTVTSVQFSPSAGITVSNVNVTGTRITATVTIAASLTPESVTVSVSSPAGTSNLLSLTVTVPDGTWNGITSDSYPLSITTLSGNITAYSFTIAYPRHDCYSSISLTGTAPQAITGSSFSFLSVAGNIAFQATVAGTFSGTKASGTVNWTSSVSGCEAASTASWNATKQ